MTPPLWTANTPELPDRLAELEWEFQVRAFGEEMARVNFLPVAQRKRYIADIHDYAMQKGVNLYRDPIGVAP